MRKKFWGAGHSMVVGRIGEWRNKWEKKVLQQEIVCLPFLEQIFFFKCTMRFENWRITGSFGMKITKRRKKNLKQKEEKFKRRFP